MAGSIHPHLCREFNDISADHVRLIQRFVSKEETRYYLCGVYMEAAPQGGALLVATDGHRLGIFHDPDGHIEWPMIYSFAPELLKMTKAPRGEPARRIRIRPDRAAEIRAWPEADNQVVGAFPHSDNNGEIDGTFPDWRRVVPDFPENHAPAWFNPLYLEAFKLDATRSAAGCITIRSESESAPAVVLNDRHPDFVGIQMPMRGPDVTEYPDWFATVLHPHRATAPAPLAIAPPATVAQPEAPETPDAPVALPVAA